VMLSTLSAIAIGLGVVGTILIDTIVEQSFDKVLGAAAHEIAGTITVERGVVSFDIPPSAFGMLENAQRDNIYYRVSQGKDVLTGYADLPVVNIPGTEPDRRAFAYATYRGQRLRIVAETRHLPRMSEPVVVQVAQTLGERRQLRLVMTAALYLLEACFVAGAGLMVWPALKWGLRPVNRIREELDARPADHANFAPLDLRNAPAELVGLVSGFNHLLERLEAAVAGIRQFTADASHQMRTPLAVLKTHLSVLSQNAPDDGRFASALADVQAATTRLEALLLRLTKLAHADEAVRGGISRSRIDVRTVIAQVAGDLVPQAAERDVALSVDAAERPVWVYAEPIIAAEILSNLVENAIRYNRRGGSVCISVNNSEQYVTVSVLDDGPGIPEAERKRVFERFYRLQRDHGQPGTGLGLSIVKTLCEAVRAHVWLESPPSGVGLKVSVQFEAANEAA
ncbi:MAG TPA: sensor histidine kinase, partial [Steroidobacteraceae bacterium]